MNAVVKYELSRTVDHEGGRSLSAPGNWVNVIAFQVSSCLRTLANCVFCGSLMYSVLFTGVIGI